MPQTYRALVVDKQDGQFSVGVRQLPLEELPARRCDDPGRLLNRELQRRPRLHRRQAHHHATTP